MQAMDPNPREDGVRNTVTPASRPKIDSLSENVVQHSVQSAWQGRQERTETTARSTRSRVPQYVYSEEDLALDAQVRLWLQRNAPF